MSKGLLGKHVTLLLAMGLAVIAASGCANRQSGWETKAPVEGAGMGGDYTTLLAEGDKYFDQRDDKELVMKAIDAYTKACNADGTKLDAYVKLSRSYYWLADAHTPVSEKEKKLELHDLGAQWGEKGMALCTPFKENLDRGKTIEESCPLLTVEYVPAMYWASSNLGRWANTKGIIASMFKLPIMKAINGQILKLDPTYWHGGPDRFFGAYYSKAPSFAGGDLNKSKEHFTKSFELDNNYFVTHVLYAELYCPKAKLPEEFRKHLEYVLNTPPEVIADLVPEQKLEQDKAKKLLAQEGELFK